MVRWLAAVLLVFASGDGAVFVFAVLARTGDREARKILFDLYVVSLIIGLALLSLVRLFPFLGL